MSYGQPEEQGRSGPRVLPDGLGQADEVREGRDATDMFNEIHKWVNYQGMMEACLVGKLVDGPSREKLPSLPSLAPPPPPQGADTSHSQTNTTIKQKLTNMITGFCTGKRLLMSSLFTFQKSQYYQLNFLILQCCLQSQ